MAHQLDFQVTLWSDDAKQLLALEQRLKQLIQELGQESNPYIRLYHLGDMIQGEPWRIKLLRQVDIHSVDINWDEESEDAAMENEL